MFEPEERSPSRKVIIGVAVVLVLLAGFFIVTTLFTHSISFPSVDQPKLNGCWVTDEGADFALNVTNLDRNQQTVSGWVDVHNSTGSLCFIFQGSSTLKAGQTGVIIANFSLAYNGYSGPISASDILSEPSVYTVDVQAAIPVPA